MNLFGKNGQPTSIIPAKLLRKHVIVPAGYLHRHPLQDFFKSTTNALMEPYVYQFVARTRSIIPHFRPQTF